MSLRTLLRAFGTERRATAAIEFVFVLPLMLSAFAGTIEFGRAWQVYGAVNRLASRYAIAWADCSDSPSGTCNTELSLYQNAAAIKNLAPQLTNPVTVRMLQVERTSTATTVRWPAGGTLTAAELTLAQATIPAPASGSGASTNTGVVVSVSYTHTLVFFQTLMSPFLGSSRSISYMVAQRKS